MPNTWIKRTIEAYFTYQWGGLDLFPVWLVLGPRQIGKSSLLMQLGSDRNYISFDDLETRMRAKADPLSFAREIKLPISTDEIQYAPEVLEAIKVLVDKDKTPGAVWITGSQNFQVMKGVRESLAGRVAILNLYGFSDEEKDYNFSTPQNYFAKLFNSNFPKIFDIQDNSSRELYLSSYLQTYVERDVVELLGINKRREFELFLKICALRTGQIINFADLARDAGISPITAKEWINLLEDSFLIKLVSPYFNNRNKRLIKSPKLYFLDMGLCAYLCGWKSSEMLRLGPMGGAALETHVFSNLLKYFRHRLKDFNISFYRTRDGAEVDFLLETDKGTLAIEVKNGIPEKKDLLKLESLFEEVTNLSSGVVLSLTLQQERPATHPLDWNYFPLNTGIQRWFDLLK